MLFSPGKLTQPLLACVLNSGTVAGVTCYDVDHAKGLTPIGPLLPIALTNTNPPVGIFNTTSDIQFSPSGKYLMVTVKGYTIKTPGYIYIWPVVNGKVSSTPVISVIPEIKQNWGFAFLSETKVLITDFPSAYDIVNVDPTTYKVTLESYVPVTGAGTCWTAYSTRFNTVFLSLAGNTNLTMVDATTGAVKGHVLQNPIVEGSVDMALDKTYLYTLSVSNYISVTDLSGLNSATGTNIAWSKEVQTYELGVPPGGSRNGFTGLAIYPAS